MAGIDRASILVFTLLIQQYGLETHKPGTMTLSLTLYKKSRINELNAGGIGYT